MLFEKSEEGAKKGLGIFPGIVKKFNLGSNLEVLIWGGILLVGNQIFRPHYEGDPKW